MKQNNYVNNEEFADDELADDELINIYPRNFLSIQGLI